MSFVYVTQQEIARREETDKGRAVLELLLAEAVGHKRALPGELIASVLQDKGIAITKHEIQSRLIHKSRAADSNYFIGSCQEGFFIINTPEDVQVMRDFYEHRIAAEQANLRNLLTQATAVGLLAKAEPAIAA